MTIVLFITSFSPSIQCYCMKLTAHPLQNREENAICRPIFVSSKYSLLVGNQRSYFSRFEINGNDVYSISWDVTNLLNWVSYLHIEISKPYTEFPRHRSCVQ